MATLTFHERISGTLSELGKAAEQLRTDLAPHERVALARRLHEETGAALEQIDAVARKKRWEGRSIKSMTVSEKSAMVADLGADEFARRLALEYSR
jgi:protein-disulfide isomerase-like protein with CxxC motif